jgi:hypothetical protein
MTLSDKIDHCSGITKVWFIPLIGLFKDAKSTGHFSKD